MARSTDEIQADIALTRQLIERQFDALARHLPRRWWMPYVAVAGALAAGMALSRVPMLRLVSVGARGVQTGLAVASALAAVDRVMAVRRSSPRVAHRRAA
jgi:hypothetical protein